MFRQFGPLEIGLVLLIIIIIFGVGKLPQVGEALGKGIRGFKKSLHGEEETKTELQVKTNADDQVTKV